MIAIIPCAGQGTRRRPDTEHLPKILLEHQDEPLIEYVARPIDKSGVCDQIVFVLNLRNGQQVIDYIKRHPLETPVKFVWQNEPLGFGHAVLQARDEVFSFRLWNPPVLIYTGDAVNTHANVPRGEDPDRIGTETNLIADITAHDVSQIGVQWRGKVRDYSMVLNKGDRVERLVEKPRWDEGGLALTGIYYIRESRRLFRCLNKLVKTGRTLNGEYQFTHALQLMIDTGTPFMTYYHDWIDCGNTRKRENEKVL